MTENLSEALLQRARQHGGDKLLEDAAAALRAVEGAAVGLVNTYGEDDELAVFGDAIDGMKIGQRVALVPLDAAGSAEGV